MVAYRSGGGPVAQASRPGLTAEQKREMWSRWKAGQSFSEIGRVLGKERSAIRRTVASTGGYGPQQRRRSLRVLSSAEREEISRGLAEGMSLRTIARRSGRAASTISREIARHGGRHRYRAIRADERAWQRARRPKPCKLAAYPHLRELVAAKLALEWSPQQISGWLARTHPGEHALQVSTETIYRSLFIQARGVLRKELMVHLRTRRTMRRSQHATTKGQGRGGIVDAVSIRERPAEAADRAVPGHWEGDLLAGSANSHIATLVERQTFGPGTALGAPLPLAEWNDHRSRGGGSSRWTGSFPAPSPSDLPLCQPTPRAPRLATACPAVT